VPYIPEVDAKCCEAVYDSIWPSPRPQYLGPLKAHINLVPRHDLARGITENIGWVPQIAGSSIDNGFSELKSISVSYAISKVTDNFCLWLVSEVSMRAECITYS
jgi:hypothetical protein